MITAFARAPLAALAACLLALAALAACHDDIPTQRDFTVSAAVDGSGSNPDQEGSRTSRDRQPEELLSYGVTEQDGFPRSTHVRYWVNRPGPEWEGVSLTLSCGGGRWLLVSNLPWEGQNSAALLISLDDLPAQKEYVHLQRYDVYSRDGHSEAASFQLDDNIWYEQLRSANTLTIELLDSDLDPVTFDLTRLFGTPFQDEIDNCAESETTSLPDISASQSPRAASGIVPITSSASI